MQNQIEAACGPRQYGAGRSGGASIQIAEVRAAARLRPNMAIVALDVKNAFGSVTWPHAFEACLRLVPDLAPALAGQWINKTLPIYIETTPIQWSKCNLQGSLLQGGQYGHPACCLVLAMALTRAAHILEGMHYNGNIGAFPPGPACGAKWHIGPTSTTLQCKHQSRYLQGPFKFSGEKWQH